LIKDALKEKRAASRVSRGHEFPEARLRRARARRSAEPRRKCLLGTRGKKNPKKGETQT